MISVKRSSKKNKRMSHLVEDGRLNKLFADFLEYIPDPICCEGQASLPDIVIPQIDNNTSISLPLTKDMISKIKSIAKESPFGQDTQTKIDEKVRKGCELETSQFQVLKAINSKNSSFIDDKRCTMHT